MNDAHRSGYNKGSADKLAGRLEDDSVPPQYRTSDGDRRAYKKGYKEGYRQTLTVRTAGYLDATAKATAKASIDASVSGGPAALLAAGLAAIAVAKKTPGGLGDDTLKDIGKYLYDKLVELGATSDQIKQVIEIAKLGISVATEVTTEAAPAEEVAPAPEKYAGFARSQASPKAEVLTVYKRLPGESVADFRARRAKEIAAEEAARKGAISPGGKLTLFETSEAQQQMTAPSWLSNNWPWVAAGTVVVAGGGYLYYRSSKS